MRIIHIIGVIYIVFVFLLPMVPTLGYDSNSLVPDASTFTSTQEEYREQLSGTDNPIISMVICLWQGEFGTLDECVEERAEQKEIANNCHNEGYDEGSSAFDECVEKENQEREEWEDSISGAVSSNLDLHVEIELTKGDFFDDDVELNSEDWGNVDYPVEVRIENPKNKEFLALVNCNFENKDDDEPSVEGIIFHNDFDEEGFLKVYESEEYDFYCEPVSPLNGTYNMNFSVMFSMETNSYLKRAYVEEYDQKKETTGSTLKDDLISEFFMGDGQNGQAYYADEFVAFVFEIGDKVTEVEKHPRLTSTIKNVGDGSIKSILWYEVYIEEMELDDDSDACLYDFIEVDEDSAIYIEEGNDKDDSFLIGSCQLKAGSKIEETVEDPTRGVYVEIFGASVSYVYELSSKFKVEVDLK